MNHGTIAGTIRRIAILGNHLPRQCGIATFTTDLSGAIAAEVPNADCFVVAMNDAGKHYAYPPRVRFEVAESDIASYRVAADFLNAQQDRCRVRAARVRHLRRQGRQLRARALTQTAHADRDDSSHHPRQAGSRAASQR